MTSNHAIILHSAEHMWTIQLRKFQKQHFLAESGFICTQSHDMMKYYIKLGIGKWNYFCFNEFQSSCNMFTLFSLTHHLIKLICIVVTYAKSESRQSGAPLQTLPYPYKNLFHVSHYSLQNLINYIISWQHDSSRNLKTAQSSSAFGWFTSFTTFVETS